jgi:hypothetical protein
MTDKKFATLKAAQTFVRGKKAKGLFASINDKKVNGKWVYIVTYSTKR